MRKCSLKTAHLQLHLPLFSDILLICKAFLVKRFCRGNVRRQEQVRIAGIKCVGIYRAVPASAVLLDGGEGASIVGAVVVVEFVPAEGDAGFSEQTVFM